MTRRALLGTCAALVVAVGAAVTGQHMGRLDEVADVVGLDPRRLPAESDEALLRHVVHDQGLVLATVSAVASKFPDLRDSLALLVEHGETHLVVLGSPTTGSTIDVGTVSATEPRAALEFVASSQDQAAKGRAKDALAAVSGEFAQVLASMSASLTQHVVLLDDARRSL